ncbi:hypothetical protein NE579_08705 [Intestinimonas massiliensis]|jgi:hypothetical protein|uniref:Uncharacterized protein n=1 Tax=Intestinimonas massiliensis (ex Afouda et al. 2020) TaxID=1673721 RepID=A0AAW5JKD8_9FIRM|nr:hypothetical protein [Intestinimonas massiliensis (ex Afouda et al. 2020)]MCQ4770541.1 hypothetical protein [Intestinimonas massiliensis (ex Afouda et al. 2020)]
MFGLSSFDYQRYYSGKAVELQGTALTNGKKYGILYELTILTGGSRGSGIEVVITGLMEIKVDCRPFGPENP